MRITVFASGSTGNCCLVRSGGTNLLIDAGISARRICQGLARAGLLPGDLTGILITHEHTDHICGLNVLMRSAPVPVYASPGTAELLRRAAPRAEAFVQVLEPELPFVLGDFTVTAFPTPHDARESFGYRMDAADGRFALATDTGCITETMLRYLSGTDVALIEANHDVDMLVGGPYPPYLKRRILSEHGHLSNSECLYLASVLAQRGTRDIILGHLSRVNNRPETAMAAVERIAFPENTRLHAAPELGFLEVETVLCCE